MLLRLLSAVTVLVAASFAGQAQKLSLPTPSAEQTAGVRDILGGAAGSVAVGAVSGVMNGHLAAAVIGRGESGRPIEERSTENLRAEDGLPAGKRTTTKKITITATGPTIRVESVLKVEEQRGPNRQNASARTVISIQACPDANGVSKLELEMTGSGDSASANVGGTGGGSYNIRMSGTATGQVGDDALLKSVTQQVESSTTFRLGMRVNAGDRRSPSITKNVENGATVRSSFPIENSTTGGRVDASAGSSNLEDYTARGDGSDEEKGRYIAMSNELVKQVVTRAYEEAQRLWRNGHCLEINVTDPAVKDGTRQTEPKQSLTFIASVRHKFEGADLPLPIDVSLSGKQSASPDRIDKAPGQISFTSGEDKRDDGTVSMKTVSRRGIAEAYSKFDNDRPIYDLQLSVGPYFVIDARVCNIEKPFEVRPKGEFGGVLVSFRPKSDSAGSFTEGGRAYKVVWKGSGNYTISWDQEKRVGRFVATNPNTATAPVGRSNNPNDMMTGTVRRTQNVYANLKCP